MPKKIVVCWRAIPSQIIVQKGRKKTKAQLSQRFQVAIDRAAMRAGKGSSDAYLEEWVRQTSQITEVENTDEFVQQEVARLEQAFSDERLEQLVKNKGQLSD